MSTVLSILFGYIPIIFGLVGGSLYFLEFIFFIPKRKKAKELEEKLKEELVSSKEGE